MIYDKPTTSSESLFFLLKFGLKTEDIFGSRIVPSPE